VNLRVGDANCDRAADDLYAKLSAAGVETLYDDRDERAGIKFADMDLIGLPWRLTVGPRGLAKGLVEVKQRAGGAVEEISAEAAVSRLAV
jgi:prolyl-tRNA synthetase